MARLETRTESSLEAATLDALEPVRTNGKLAAVYLQYAVSETALRAYLAMETALQKGSLSNGEIEAIKILVSDRLGCDFCSTVHATKGRRAGLSGPVQDAIRVGNPTGDERLDAILALVRTLLVEPGSLSEELIAMARKASLTDENLMDLTLAAATIFFTNITNHVNDTRLG